MKGGIYRVYEPIRSVTDGYLTKFMSAHREFETTAASNSFCFFSFLLFLFFPLSFSLFFFSYFLVVSGTERRRTSRHRYPIFWWLVFLFSPFIPLHRRRFGVNVATFTNSLWRLFFASRYRVWSRTEWREDTGWAGEWRFSFPFFIFFFFTFLPQVSIAPSPFFYPHTFVRSWLG